MSFRLHQAQYDDQTERAYVEFRRGDGDGGEQLVVAIFTYRTKERLSKQRIKEEVVRKARHILKGAAVSSELNQVRALRRNNQVAFDE